MKLDALENQEMKKKSNHKCNFKNIYNMHIDWIKKIETIKEQTDLESWDKKKISITSMIEPKNTETKP